MVFTIDDTDDIDEFSFFEGAHVDVEVVGADFHARVGVRAFLDKDNKCVACLIDIHDFCEKGNFGVVVLFEVIKNLFIFFDLDVVVFIFEITIDHKG
jgi:hypothetical protein